MNFPGQELAKNVLKLVSCTKRTEKKDGVTSQNLGWGMRIAEWRKLIER